MEIIKCYLCGNEKAEMKLDPEGGSEDELVWCEKCEFYLLTSQIKKRFFETELLTEDDKEKLSQRVKKEYDPEKPKDPVEITKEMIKEETGKESVGYIK